MNERHTRMLRCDWLVRRAHLVVWRQFGPETERWEEFVTEKRERGKNHCNNHMTKNTLLDEDSEFLVQGVGIRD